MYLIAFIDCYVFILDPVESIATDMLDEASEWDTIYKADSGLFLY